MSLRLLLRHSVNCLPYSLRSYIRLIPGVAFFQRLLVKNILAGEFVHCINVGPAKGLKMPIALPTDKAMWAGLFEKEFASALAAAIPKGKVCFDIGGYKGYMSGVMTLNGASSVHVFEPLPANQESIRRLCALNPDLKIQLHSYAVGASNSTMMLNVMPDSSMGKLADSPFQKDVFGKETIEVQVVSLDSLHANGSLPTPSLLKIDVEGAEVSVLEGMGDLLSHYHPIIFLEAHSEELEAKCRAMLERFSYQVRRLESGELQDTVARHIVARNV
jgi:FkbM family methyltransferase